MASRRASRYTALAAVLFCTAALHGDLLLLEDGSRVSGTLRVCDEETCSIDKRRIPLDRIVQIVLGNNAKLSVTRKIANVVMTDGTLRTGRFTGLNAGYVYVDDEEIERELVALIFPREVSPEQEAGPPPEPPPEPPPGPPPGPQYRPDPPSQQPPPAEPSPTPQPVPPPPTPPPPPTHSPAAPSSTLTPGRLWTGTMSSRLWGTVDGVFSEVQVHVDVRLREYVAPMIDPTTRSLKPVGTLTTFGSEGSVMRESVRCSGSGISCSGQGSITITGGPGDVRNSGAIYRMTSSVSAVPVHGFEIPEGKALYLLGIGPRDNPTFDVTWRTDVTSIAPQGFSPLVAGRVPIVQPGELSDLEYRYLEGGMMRGSFNRTLSGGKQYSMSWSVCPEGTACPPAPPLPEGDSAPDDPCARAGQQAALRDTCRAQLDSMLDSLGPALAEYNALMASAEANRQAFQDAQTYCALYDTAKQVLEAILSGGAGPAAEAARALVYLRDVIAKVQSGDLGSMLYPSEVQKFLGDYGKAKEVWFELTADEVSKMRRDLGACSGKMPADTFLGAQKFVEDLAAAKRVWNDRVAPGMNDLRSKGLECANADHAAWRACIEDAECRGVPPDCGPEPSLEGAYD